MRFRASENRRSPFRLRRGRHGVVLLVVLSLLTLLVVIGMTLALVAGQFRRAQEAFLKAELQGDPPIKLTDRAIYQVLRDSDTRSRLHSHSLLRDLYGNDGVRGQVGAAVSQLGDEVLAFQFTPDTVQPFGNNFSGQSGYYNGCVITFLDPMWTPGPDEAWGVRGTDDDGNGALDDMTEAGANGSDDVLSTGHSVRVIGYQALNLGDPPNNVPPSPGILVVETTGEDDVARAPRAGSRFLINGRPFNGRGQGYAATLTPISVSPNPGLDAYIPAAHHDSVHPNNNSSLPDLPVALLPNVDGYQRTDLPINPAFGGMDESWDAVDYQNFYLAMVPPDVSLGVIPSYHRPALVNYWKQWVARNLLAPIGINNPQHQDEIFKYPFGRDNEPGTADDPTSAPINFPLTETDRLFDIVYLKRMFITRPLPEDNPNFTGGNAFFAETYGQALPDSVWDIDNDGDGRTDSNWNDLGFPVQTARNGRRYKPLFAILIKDMDGRLNINAHSNPAHSLVQYATPMGQVTATPAGPYAGGGIRQLRLPRGLGYGPADVYLGHIFDPTSGDFQRILRGRYRTNTVQSAGIDGVDDTLSIVKGIGLPADYATQLSHFASPPDLWGRGAVGIDYAGQPVTTYMGQTGETVGDPYELALNGAGAAGAADAPYTEADLERLLRYHDVDAFTLSGRLPRDATTLNLPGADRERNLVTTHSSFLSIPNAAIPLELRNRRDLRWNPGPDGKWGRPFVDDDGNGTVDDLSEAGADYPPANPNDFTTDRPKTTVSLLDLYAAKLRIGGVPEHRIGIELEKIVPFEIRHGQRFDINRWLGNGADDNGDFVVDDPRERTLNNPEFIWPPGLPGGFTARRFDYLNGESVAEPQITDPQYSPQIMARHLYCLMMLLTDLNYVHPAVQPAPFPPMPAGGDVELTALRMAQWSINVVDFRDADAIMTPFEYDVNPWNGWGLYDPSTNPPTVRRIDGDPATNEFRPPGAQPRVRDRRLAWGSEGMDLALTEIMAFHDRRVADTPNDRGDADVRNQTPNRGDDDLDQYRIPQGSLFVELYATRTHAQNNPRLPRELYDANGRLDLGRLSRPDPASGRRSPVWRLVISEPIDGAVANPANPLLAHESGPTANFSFNPVEVVDPATGMLDAARSFDMNLLSALRDMGPREQLNPERVVWFAPFAPVAGTPEGDITFFGRTGTLGAASPNLPRESTVVVAPGSYAVAGPRPRTRIGAADDGDPATFFDPSPHMFQLTGGTFTVIDNDGNDRLSPRYGNDINAPVGIVCAAHPPATWMDGGLRNAGIGMNVSEPMPQANYYEEPTYTFDGVIGLPDGYDEPDPSMRANTFPDEPFDNRPNRPLADNEMQKTGTELQWKAAFLQRLANPLEPWHVTRNPYVTVDWSMIDLTVFNGEDREPGTWTSMQPWDPQDAPPSKDIRFATRQRGEARLNEPAGIYGPPTLVGPADFDFWRPTSAQPVETQNAPLPELHWQHNAKHTLGYLNATMGTPQARPGIYRGTPQQPFPWLAWLNRPFANPYELMLVPSSTPSRLTHEFTVRDPAMPVNGYTQFQQGYGHLLNFLHTTDPSAPPPAAAAHFYRLFDYVETPSPFVGTEKWFNPVRFQTGVGAAVSFRPPYNRMSRFRDPGRININTIFDPAIWEGLTKGTLYYDPSDPTGTGIGPEMFLRVFESRRGYNSATRTNLLELDPLFPTFFANPFRAADSADMMPPLDGAGPDRLRLESAVDATLLRRDGFLTEAAPVIRRQEPLLVPDASADPSLNAQPRNPDRNAFFRYQAASQLANQLSTNSNVFAVWVTVGFFEVEPAPNGPSRTHLDGFRLGQEIGADSGEVVRHRGFYIVDRSIPVAFEPGRNHNVDRAILLRRFIE